MMTQFLSISNTFLQTSQKLIFPWFFARNAMCPSVKNFNYSQNGCIL